MNHKGTVILETSRLILRPFKKEDGALAFKNWMGDDRVTKFLRWPSHRDQEVTNQSIGSWVEGYKKKDFYQWAIVLKDLGEPIGSISIGHIDERVEMVHIGYCIGYRWWNLGITTEAFKRILPFIFDELEAKRVESMHDPNNPGSGRVMEKCGLKFEGLLRKADWSNQGVVDGAMYSLLAEEYYGNEGGTEEM